ncbi:MAG: flavin reductase family protein [Pseudomonadota bacterium]
MEHGQQDAKPPPSSPEDGEHFRSVLSHYPTGVCVIASRSDAGTPLGMVVGTFTSVSLDPPLVGFLPGRGSDTWPLLERTGVFCVNILAADQRELCAAMAAKGVDRFANVDWRPAGSGAPIITGCVGWMDCRLEAVTPAGDHHFVIGRVRELNIETSKPPLVFLRGEFGAVARAR